MATLTLIDDQARAAVAPPERAAKTQEAATVLADLEPLLSVDDPLKRACSLLSFALTARRGQKGYGYE